MPLDTTFVKGRPTQVFVGPAAPVGQKATAPTPVTLTVGSAGAAQGATSIPVTASASATITKNTILVFEAGEVDECRVVVTADTPVSAVEASLPVDSVEGEEGDGIPFALEENDTAEWDAMYRLLGTQQSDYSLSENTQNLQSVTYDSAEAMAWDESEDTSKSWQIQRSGRYKPTDYAFQQVRLAAHEGREIWVKQVTPDEDGNPIHSKSGRAKVRGYTETNPADGIYDASWTFAGQGKPVLADIT